MDRDHEAATTVAENPAGSDRITQLANVTMTPFSVIASTCMQVILMGSLNLPEDQALCFSLLSASVIATAGMLMAIFLVSITSCSPKETTSKPPKNEQPKMAKFLAFAKQLLYPKDEHYEQPVCDEQEQIRIARMMLRCLWFSLSYMVTGLLGRFLRDQAKITNRGIIASIALVTWFIFLWSGFGAPLPKFYPCFKVLGRLFTTAFPVILMVVYTVLYFTE